MTRRRFLTAAEAQVLERALPPGLTTEVSDMALCLFEAIVIDDARCGQGGLISPDWAAQLGLWAEQVRKQVQHLSAEKGGTTIYLAKGMAVIQSARDREMCERFRGNNYRELARDYSLTEMRVRQIVNAYQRERYAQRQSSLPGLEGACA